MKNSTIKAATLIILFAIMLGAVFACAAKKSLPTWHPVDVTGLPKCSECHKDDRTALDHTPDFAARHKLYAVQQKQVCDLCHVQAFCADCHANDEELKPSDKYKDAPQRVMPHPGDYLTQHKIDGKINPAPCFRCHGRQNNERCKACHT